MAVTLGLDGPLILFQVSRRSENSVRTEEGGWPQHMAESRTWHPGCRHEEGMGILKAGRGQVTRDSVHLKEIIHGVAFDFGHMAPNLQVSF